MSNQQHEGRIYGPTPFGLLDSQTTYWISRTFPAKQKGEKFNLKVAVGLGLISVGLSGCTLSSPIAAPLPQDYVAPPLLTPEPSATPTFIPPTTTPAPSETPKSATPQPTEPAADGTLVAALPTVAAPQTPTSIPIATKIPDATATLSPSEQALKELNQMSKTDAMDWIKKNYQNPNMFPPVTGRSWEFKDGLFIMTTDKAASNRDRASFYFLFNTQKRPSAIVTRFDYNILEPGVSPGRLRISNLDLAKSPQDFNAIDIQKVKSVEDGSEWFFLMFMRVENRNVAAGVNIIDLSKEVSSDPRQLIKFGENATSMKLIDLTTGKQLAFANFADLKDSQGNLLFPDGSFSPGGLISINFTTAPGHQIVIKELAMFK